MIFQTNNLCRDITLRHEEKFICSQKDLFLIENRIKCLLPTDQNQKSDSYNIRSIYMDTYQDRMLNESLQGLRMRSKFRIRTYDTANSIIRLEKKVSIGQLKKKISCRLSREDVARILDDPFYPMEQQNAPEPLGEMIYLQKTEGLVGKIIVEYSRAAYVCNTGNIRITFDRNIGASNEVHKFFDPQIMTHSILPSDQGILEVKYDGILPGYVAKALALHSLQRVSFSKYALCRNILDNNGQIEEYYEF